ncbi:hypothetical protein FIM43_07975, partial [Helicobacter pylori]
SLAFLSFSLILFLMFNVWFRWCWFVLGVYGFIVLFKVFRGFKKTSLMKKGNPIKSNLKSNFLESLISLERVRIN